jgi:hypothetical protein
MKSYDLYSPIFILFGDYHFSNEKQCLECKNIYCIKNMMEFTEKINSLSTIKFPIDFFLEEELNFKNTRRIHMEDEKINNLPPLDKVIAQGYHCFYRNNTLRIIYCKSPNIRWHFADVRFNYINKYNYETFQETLFIFIQNSIKNKNLSSLILFEPFLNQKNRDGEIILIKFLKVIKYIGTQTYFRKVLLTGSSIIDKQLSPRNINFIEDNYTLIVDLIDNDIFNTLKQSLSRYRITLMDFNIYITQLVDLLINYFNSVSNKDKFESKIELNILVNPKYDDDVEIQKNKRYMITVFRNLLLNLNANMVDYYLLLRTFKKPFNKKKCCYDNNSILNISYLGNDHSRHIYELLYKYGYYDIIYSNQNISSSDEYRCIKFEEDIDINMLLNKLKTNYTKFDKDDTFFFN